MLNSETVPINEVISEREILYNYLLEKRILNFFVKMY